MGQYARLFFPEEDWPVQEEILRTAIAPLVFISSVIHASLWGYMFFLNQHNPLYLL